MALELSIVRSGHLDITLDRDIHILDAFAAEPLGVPSIVKQVLGTLIKHLLVSLSVGMGSAVSFLLLVFVIDLSLRFLQVNRFDKGECDEVFARL